MDTTRGAGEQGEAGVIAGPATSIPRGIGWLGELGLWLFLLPASGYGAVYLFRFGQASVWRFPIGLISFGVSDLAFVGVAALGALLVAGFYGFVIDRWPSERLRLAAVVGLAAVYIGSGVYFEFLPRPASAAIVLALVVFSAIAWWYSPLRRWVLRRLGLFSPDEAVDSTAQLSMQQTAVVAFVVVVTCVGVWSLLVGQSRARFQTTYYVYEAATPLAGQRWFVLEDWNDRLIVGLAQGTTLLGRYRVAPTMGSSIDLTETVALTPPQ